MTKSISAFVAHSFTEDDATVVNAVLNCLTRAAELNPSFSWTHARHPEPISVDEKVLALLEGKNLFIGICTRKERVVSPNALSSCWMSRQKLAVNENALEWKTSDWIIQEIGLAIGRGMDIILLVEEGIRSPGALQGNLESIRLYRDAPERSFDALLAMLATLTPRPTDGAAAAVPPSPSEPEKSTDHPEHDWTKPKPEWNRDHFEFAMMHCVATKDDQAKEVIDNAFLASKAGASEKDKMEWLAYKEYICIALERGGDLSRLEAIATEWPDNANVTLHLAGSYALYDEHGKAASLYLAAAGQAKSVISKIERLGLAARCFEKAGKKADADRLASQIRTICADAHEGEMELLLAEKALAELRKDDDTEIGLMERQLELTPTDNETRFGLAYKYSSIGRANMAAYHYSRIRTSARSAIAWNNFGVALESLKLPLKAVEAYRNSAHLGETLAMSNLAHQFLNAGFVGEAKQILDEALRLADHHKNVDKALGVIRDRVDDEENEETSVYEKAKPVSEFFRSFGQARIKPLVIGLQGTWKAPACDVVVQIDGTSLVARGTYELKANGLVAAALMGTRASDFAPVKYFLEYRGDLYGQTVSGNISRGQVNTTKSAAASTLLGTETKPTFLMWLGDSGTVIYVMERPTPDRSRFYQLERI
jgi:tetratricopeptide (TPR) repeat protein